VNGTAHSGFIWVMSFLLAFHPWRAPALHAQALVPDRGEGMLTLTYQNYDVVGHYNVHGHKNTNGGSQSHVLLMELDYGILEKVGLTLGLPFIASKYTGPPSYFVGPYLTHPGPLDDRTYHAAFQDLRVEVRRQWWAGPVPVTPFVEASVPTHDYETVGEAVPGRHRRDMQVGANTALDLDRILPGAYVHGRYAYGAMERVRDFPFTRSNVDLEGGYAILPRLVVRGLAAWQVRHRGPALDQLASDWVHHDRFIAPSYINVGGGVSLSVMRSMEVNAVWVGTAAGSNGAHRAQMLAIGAGFQFGSGLHGLAGANGSSRNGILSSTSVRGRFLSDLERGECER
jgi:hypothetical protein